MNNDLLLFFGTIPWILFLLIVLAVNCKKPKYSRLVFLFIFVLVFSAIRYGIGYDYFSYKETIESEDSFELERWELLPRLLGKFSKIVGTQFFFIVCSFLSLTPIFFVTKKISRQPVLSFSIFLLFPMFYLETIGIIRNGVAYSFVILMFYFLLQKKPLLSVLSLLCAVGFHTSALVAVLVFFFYRFPLNRKIHFIAYISSFVLSAIVLTVLQSFSSLAIVNMYLENKIGDGSHGGMMMSIIINAIGIINLLYWKRITLYYKENIKYISLVNVGVCLWNIFLPVDQTSALRFATYFLLFVIFLVPTYTRVFRIKHMKRWLLAFVTLLFVTSFYLSINSYRKSPDEHMANVPYQVFFLNPSDAFKYN